MVSFIAAGIKIARFLYSWLEVDCFDDLMFELPIRVSILGISGSPRGGGNSEFLLDQALEAAKEVSPENVYIEKYSIAGKKYLPCTSCFACVHLKRCILSEKDDFSELCEKWMGADAVIISVPVYHMGIPGQLKCFFDRLGNSVDRKYDVSPKWFKVYGIITQGAHIFSGQEQTAISLIIHALMMGNIVIAGDCPESYIGGCGWTMASTDKNALRTLYNNKEISATFAVKSSRSVGKRVAELSLIIKAGGLFLIDRLKSDPAYTPFVNRITKAI